MGLKWTTTAFVAVWLIAGGPAIAGPGSEPYWNSKPLSYWVTALSGHDTVGRVLAATSLAEMAIAHGGAPLASAVPQLVPNLGDPIADIRESAAHALADRRADRARCRCAAAGPPQHGCHPPGASPCRAGARPDRPDLRRRDHRRCAHPATGWRRGGPRLSRGAADGEWPSGGAGNRR